MTDHVIDRVCSICDASMKLAASVIGAPGAPVPGDPIVCRNCGARLVYDAARRLRSLSPLEFLAFGVEVRRAINAARNAATKGDANMNVDLTLLVACVALCSIVEVLPW